MSSGEECPSIRRCECGICETTFTDDSAVGIARSLAKHWNAEHGDELRHEHTPYKTEQYGGRHIHGDEYAYQVQEYYVTVYDVLNPNGDTLFKYEYAKQPEAEDVCEDCWQSIEAAAGYRELDTDGWRDKYRCDECHRQRRIERRREENQSLDRFAVAAGGDER